MSLKSKAEAAGVQYIDKGNGHVQLKGPLLVNYYPNSKTRTAYVAGTQKGMKHVSEDDAIRMCFEAPGGNKTVRKPNYRKEKERLILKSNKCHWCNVELNIETATLDHRIPLSKGGLNNFNNYVLACFCCNQRRGNAMPELSA